MCVRNFARRMQLSDKSAFNYLYEHKGIAFLDEYYNAEHLLSIDDAVDDLIHVCKLNGGVLQ